ncbi:MAG: hypothetical protein FWD49_06995 [Firmicutes bacterium]|nr:hypothetical protein [Bacillota bacterium]
MTKQQLPSYLGIVLLPSVVKILCDKRGITEKEAVALLYKSELYSLLEDEETKLWHCSPLALCGMLESELNMGKIEFPEGV